MQNFHLHITMKLVIPTFAETHKLKLYLRNKQDY